MDKICKLLSKYDTFKLSKSKLYQELILDKEKLLKDSDVSIIFKDEFDLYKNEIILKSIKNKIMLETTFNNTYGLAMDYWDSLSYEQRLKLVNTDLDKIKKDIVSFVYDDKIIYIPIFDTSLNEMYANEITLLLIKKYRHLYKEYNKLIDLSLYDNRVFASDFSSLDFIKQNNQLICVYNKEFNKIYLIDKFKIMFSLSFNVDVENHKEQIATYLLEGNVKKLISYLVDNYLIDDKISKKLLKYNNKLDK